MAQILRKIDVVTVLGGVSQVRKLAGDGEKSLCRIVGYATRLRKWQKVAPDGEIRDGHALVGEFKAINIVTGAEFMAPECFLPRAAQAMIEGKFTEDTQYLEFALDIGVKESSESITGYEYTVMPIIGQESSAKLAALEQKLKQLGGPESKRK